MTRAPSSPNSHVRTPTAGHAVRESQRRGGKHRKVSPPTSSATTAASAGGNTRTSIFGLCVKILWPRRSLRRNEKAPHSLRPLPSAHGYDLRVSISPHSLADCFPDVRIPDFAATGGRFADTMFCVSQKRTHWKDPSLSSMSIPGTSRLVITTEYMIEHCSPCFRCIRCQHRPLIERLMDMRSMLEREKPRGVLGRFPSLLIQLTCLLTLRHRSTTASFVLGNGETRRRNSFSHHQIPTCERANPQRVMRGVTPSVRCSFQKSRLQMPAGYD